MSLMLGTPGLTQVAKTLQQPGRQILLLLLLLLLLCRCPAFQMACYCLTHVCHSGCSLLPFLPPAN
jgi:hypothetical protein